MKRVMVIGFSGSGKSTLAKRIADAIGTDATHLDSIHWLPDWKENTVENEVRQLSAVLDREKWVVDGNYSRVLFKERADMADTIIFLDINRCVRLFRVFKRYFRYRGKTRSDMADGCPEKIDAEFVKWVLYKGMRKRDRYIEMLSELALTHPEKQIYILKSSGQVRDFLRRSRID